MTKPASHVGDPRHLQKSLDRPRLPHKGRESDGEHHINLLFPLPLPILNQGTAFLRVRKDHGPHSSLSPRSALNIFHAVRAQPSPVLGNSYEQEIVLLSYQSDGSHLPPTYRRQCAPMTGRRREPPFLFCPCFFSFYLQADYSIAYVAIITNRKKCISQEDFPMKYRNKLEHFGPCVSLMAFLLLLTIRARSQEALGQPEQFAPNILRFHVLAESNRAEDQELKIGVKNLILAYVHSQCSCGRGQRNPFPMAHGKSRKNRDTIRGMAEKPGMLRPGSPGAGQRLLSLQILRGYGISPADFTMRPELQSVRGEGRNWWCVLYPSLCFVDSVHAVVPASSRRELSSVLAEKDYAALLPPGGLSTAASPAGGSVSAGGSGPADASGP